MHTDQPSAAPPWWFLLLSPVLAFALVFAAFGPALQGQFLGWDDGEGVARNADLRLGGAAGLEWRFTTRHMGHYQPLSWWSLSLDVADAPVGELGPREAARCHRTNLLLHALGAVAFALLAERLLRAAWRGFASPPSFNATALAALFASFVWALHPLRVESVAWITERRDVLSVVPLLLSVYMYVLWAEQRAVSSRGGRTGFFVASLALLLISLLAKAWGIVVPALLIVLDFYPLRRARFGWRALGALLVEKTAFIGLAAIFAFLAAWAQSSQPDAMPSLAEHTLFERTLQAAYGLCFYAWKSIMPTGLMPLYELPKDISFFEPRFFSSVLAVAGLVGLLFTLRRRLPSLCAAAIAGAILVAPVLGFAQAGPQLVADRYAYLFGLAFALLVAGFLLTWSRALRFIPWILGAVLLAMLAAATRAQTAHWHDTQSLWSHVLAREPGHVVANLSLGNEFARRAAGARDAQEAAQLFRAAERCFTAGLNASDDARFAARLALIHRALAKLEPEREADHLRAASEFSERAVQLAIATGRVKPETRLEHGLHLLSIGRTDEALVELEWYAKVRPDDARGQRALAQALRAR